MLEYTIIALYLGVVWEYFAYVQLFKYMFALKIILDRSGLTGNTDHAVFGRQFTSIYIQDWSFCSLHTSLFNTVYCHYTLDTQSHTPFSQTASGQLSQRCVNSIL